MAIHRSPAERHDIVTRWLASPLSTQDFAAHEGVSPSSLHRWRRLVEEETSPMDRSAFVEIAVSDFPSPPRIEIDLGDVVVRVPSGCDAASLATVLDVLRDAQ